MIIGQALDPNLAVGTIFREDPRGTLFQRGTEMVYIPAGLEATSEEPMASAGLWHGWISEFRAPQIIAVEVPMRAVGWVPPHEQPARVVTSLLTIKVNGVVFAQGTEEAGININVEDSALVTDGTGTVTVTW